MMNKRVFSVLMAALMLLSCLTVGAVPVFAATSATVTVGSVSGNVGDIVEVPVSITANSYIVNADMYVTFDPTVLELVDYYDNPDDDGTMVCYSTAAGFFNNRWMYLGNEKKPGLFVFAGASNSKMGISKGGEMFRLAFKILSADANGTKIVFSADPICGNDGSNTENENGFPVDFKIALTTVDGVVTVTAGMRGDMDDTGVLNMMDALLLYSGVANGTLTDDDLYVADFNGDGTANMMDALLLYNAVST